MNNYFKKYKKIFLLHKQGFVLPFTLFVCSIMILITTAISTILTKQIYFSGLSRQSQAAYYAADNAVLCTIMVDSTYTDETGIGILPYATTSEQNTHSEALALMDTTLTYVNDHRLAMDPPQAILAPTLNDIKCAQSDIFDTNKTSFDVSPVVFSRIVPAHDAEPESIEYGRTSTFNMKMDLGGGIFRCAKVTVNKTASYRQIIAQGYAICDRPDGSVERAVVDTTSLR